MSAGTSIQWTDATWNPTRGCSRVSEGCRNCYAERIAVRMSGPGQWGEGFADVRSRHSENGRATTGVRGHWTGKVALVPEKLDEPLRWRKPRRVFVNSMSDLFHEGLPDEAIDQVFSTMIKAQRHTFQVLTKRPERMRAWVSSRGFHRLQVGHVWLGVSVEDQKTADERIPLLLETPAAVRFVSAEPLLGPINFDPWVTPCRCTTVLEHRRLDWVICGGESGPGARPMDLAWARSIVAQCREAGTKCFVKQLGRVQLWPTEDAQRHEIPRDPKGGDPAEWPEDLRVREFPA